MQLTREFPLDNSCIHTKKKKDYNDISFFGGYRHYVRNVVFTARNDLLRFQK